MAKTITARPDLRRGSLRALALLAGLALLTLVVWLIVTRYHVIAGSGPGQNPMDSAQSAFVERTGVRVIRVAVAAGGGMIDLRYQVVNPDKAVIVHDKAKPPAVVDERTGQVLNRPWMDMSHAGELHAGVTYYELLVNSGGLVKPGGPVSVVIGGARLEHLIAQ